MRRVSFTLWHTLTPLLVGFVVVASVMPIREVVFLGWVGGLFCVGRDSIRSHHMGRAFVALGLQASLMTGVIAAAVMAPVKIADELLQAPVTLPSQEMTLADIEQWARKSRISIPIGVWFAEGDLDATTPIRFPDTTISLRQFLSTVEGQTSLRHRFHGCGNGYTVLWGNDCSFGLGFSEE